MAITLLRRTLTGVVIAIFSISSASAAKVPKAKQQTIGDLQCSGADVARFDGSLWICSPDLSANESAVVNAQTTADGAQTAASDAQSRVGILEGQNLDGRVTDLEAASGSLTRTIVVSPEGPTDLDNGQLLLDAANDAVALNPTSTSRVLIQLEPGRYDLGTSTVVLLSNISLAGSGPLLTTIKSSVALTTPPRWVLQINGGNVEVREVRIEVENATGGAQRNAGAIIVHQIGSNISIRNVDIVGPGGSQSGVQIGRPTRLDNVRIEQTLFSIDLIGTLGPVDIVNSDLTDSGSILTQFGGLVRIRNSIIQNLAPQAGFFEIAGSQILGTNTDSTHTTCVFSYDGSLLPLGSDCLP